MKHNHIARIFSALTIAIMLSGAAFSTDISSYTKDLQFDMPEFSAPVFPDRTMNIVDFGAVGDGRTVNTEAIKNAINSCTEKGGGTVFVPEGIWLTGPVKLENNINLHLDKNATLQFVGTFEDYPLFRSTWEGKAEVRCVSPIFGYGLENIAITGTGVIDGGGDNWRPVKKSKLTKRAWNELIKSGGVVTAKGDVWWPSKGAMNGRALVNKLNARGNAEVEDYLPAREYLRPVMVNLVKCKNILLDGPTFQNSPAWNLHPLLSENIIIRNINVRNPWYSQNGDGIDLESCKNVIMYNSKFDVGDDGICIKSGKNEYGRERGVPTENVVIADCIVYHGHGGFTVGSEMSGGVKNIDVRRLTFLGTDVGLRFKSTRGRGGVVENIYIKDIYMQDIVMEAIRFNLFYAHKEPIPAVDGDGKLAVFKEVAPDPVTEETPQFKNIFMDNIICNGAGQAALVYGLPEMAVNNIHMSNIDISATNGFVGVDTENLNFTNLKLTTKKEPVMLFLNSRDITISNPFVNEGLESFLFVDGKKSAKIKIVDHDGQITKSMITAGDKVSKKAVHLGK